MGKSKKSERVNGEVEKTEKPAETVAADASAEHKSKKRKRTEAAAENETVKAVAETNGATEEKPKKKSKKSKGEKEEEEKKKKKSETAAAAEEPAEATKEEKTEKKEKKDKKDKKKKSKKDGAAAGEPETSQPNDGEPMTVAVPEEHDEAAANNDESQKAGKSRWIVFIGNLPFSATTTSVSAHFASLKPIGVRLLTDKATGKSRGIAFVEFDNYDRMKTCLEKYHHTEFNDGVSAARKINVELT